MDKQQILERVYMAKVGSKKFIYDELDKQEIPTEVREYARQLICASLDYYCELIHQEIKDAFEEKEEK